MYSRVCVGNKWAVHTEWALCKTVTRCTFASMFWLHTFASTDKPRPHLPDQPSRHDLLICTMLQVLVQKPFGHHQDVTVLHVHVSAFQEYIFMFAASVFQTLVVQVWMHAFKIGRGYHSVHSLKGHTTSIHWLQSQDAWQMEVASRKQEESPVVCCTYNCCIYCHAYVLRVVCV